MENRANTIAVLNDLIAILNDRIEGYTRAKEELDGKEPDLNDLCLQFIDESRALRLELGTEVEALQGETETDTTVRGKFYRAWMDVKTAFAGSDRHSVLSSCEYGEDVAKRAYKIALTESDLPDYIRSIVQNQQYILSAAHEKIKELRDNAVVK